MNTMNEDTVRTLLADVASAPEPPSRISLEAARKTGRRRQWAARLIASGGVAVLVAGGALIVPHLRLAAAPDTATGPAVGHPDRRVGQACRAGQARRPGRRAHPVQPAGTIGELRLAAQLLERGRGQRRGDADLHGGEPGAWANPQGEPPRLVPRSQPLREHPRAVSSCRHRPEGARGERSAGLLGWRRPHVGVRARCVGVPVRGRERSEHERPGPGRGDGEQGGVRPASAAVHALRVHPRAARGLAGHRDRQRADERAAAGVAAGPAPPPSRGR